MINSKKNIYLLNQKSTDRGLWFSVLIFLFLFHFSLSSIAQERKKLYFPPEKNNILILPQKFEYQLMDKDKIKIGDVLIDSQKLTFEIEKNKNRVNFKFNWPSGLLQEGEIILFNNYGKSEWKSNFTIKDLVKNKSIQDQQDQLIRADEASFTSDSMNNSIIEDLKLFPFLRFCIRKKTTSTTIDLCSAEFYISTENDEIKINNRKSSQKNPQILINDKTVGDQGIIFLNDESESILLKAQLESGANLEILTRLKPINFIDAVMSNDKKFIKFTARGSSPINENDSTQITDNYGQPAWEISLPVDFPVVYIRGDGNIPMKQEFYIKGPVPQEIHRTYALKNFKGKTYDNNFVMEIATPKKSKIYSRDDKNKLSLNKNSVIEWELKNIQNNQENIRYSYLKTDSNSEFSISHNLVKESPISLLTGIDFMGNGIGLTHIGVDWQFENLYSSISITSDFPVLKNADIADFSSTVLSYKLKFQKGLNQRDPYQGISISYKDLKAGSLKYSLIGIGYFLKTKESIILKDLFSSNLLDLKYYYSLTNNDNKLLQYFEIDYYCNLPIKINSLLSFGMGFKKTSWDNTDFTSKFKEINPNLKINYTYFL